MTRKELKLTEFNPTYSDLPASRGHTHAVWQVIAPRKPSQHGLRPNVPLSMHVTCTSGGGFQAFLHGQAKKVKDNDKNYGSINGYGHASANSGGYCKETHCAEQAFRAAGVHFNSYGFGGERDIERALQLLARRLGYRSVQIQRIYCS